MGGENQRTRLQIPVSKEVADYVSELGRCLNWSQPATAAALLQEGIKSQQKLQEWLGERLAASIVNVVRGKPKIKASGEPTVYIQTLVDREAVAAIEQMAVKLNNSPVRMAALVLELAAFDNGWVIEALGSGPGKALVRFVKSRAAKKQRERIAPAGK